MHNMHNIIWIICPHYAERKKIHKWAQYIQTCKIKLQTILMFYIHVWACYMQKYTLSDI